jgi:hypothetical protein
MVKAVYLIVSDRVVLPKELHGKSRVRNPGQSPIDVLFIVPGVAIVSVAVGALVA